MIDRYQLNELGSPIEPSTWRELNENWELIKSYLRFLQRQLDVISGKDAQEIMDRLDAVITNGEKATLDAVAAKQAVDQALLELSALMARATTAAERAEIAAEEGNRINTLLSALQLELEALQTDLNTIVQSEAQRIANENARTLAEGERATAETTRQSNETARENNELARIESAANATNAANAAAARAEGAADAATNATNAAITATNNANSATTETIQATTAANDATVASITQTQAAQTATNNANEEASNLSQLKTDVTNATTTANTAATQANEATNNANAATSSAVQATLETNTAKENAVASATNANNAATLANGEVANLAQLKSETAGATQEAIKQAGFAKEQGDRAKTEADRLAGTDVSVLDNRLTNLSNEVTKQFADTARQTAVLSQGTSVVSSENAAIADVEIEGRTLVALGNSNLEAGKKYVLADPKTRLVTDGKTISGVDKFTKGTTTLATANFVGKVSGSIVENPHVTKRGYSNVLIAPNGSWVGEIDTSSYAFVQSLNASSYLPATNGNTLMAQTLFSFNLIEEVERKLGRIPRTTVADKVQWLKDNLNRLTANWHGFGSSVEGNKATLAIWDALTNNGSAGWHYNASHTHIIGSITKISRLMDAAVIASRIDSNGFVHFLAFAEPSNGVIASTINTDYVDLEVELKSTAQLDTRPKYIRIANFEGKVDTNLTINPHKAFIVNNGDTLGAGELQVPNHVNWYEYRDSHAFAKYSSINSLNGTVSSAPQTRNGKYAQVLFSFNLIEEVERNIGKIPRTTVADKVQWLRDNVNKFTLNWHGFGSSPLGNGAILRVFYNGAWSYGIGNVSSTVTKSTHSAMNRAIMMPYCIQSDGFIHYLAYAEPSNGTTNSIILTDYVELEIELKETADFTQPKVPLYEVTDTDYSKVLVEWNADEVMRRYPSVQVMQHVQGIGIVAEGENLLPPFTEWVLHANARAISPYEFELNATAGGQASYIILNVVPNASYTITFNTGLFNIYDYTSGAQGSIISTTPATGFTRTFTIASNQTRVIIYLSSSGTGTFTFTNPMLTLGSTPKPFVPRNPSYLYADAELGAIGNRRDILFKRDDRWLLRKTIEKDVVLDGSLGWAFQADDVQYKTFRVAFTGNQANTDIVTKNNGKKIVSVMAGVTIVGKHADLARFDSGMFYLNVSDFDSGYAEAYTPTANDIKRYFNGWKYSDGVTWTSVTGNGQTATAQQALDTMPTDYTPYRLSYVLATPQVIDVTDKVEGALKLNGLTQVNVDAGYRRTVVDGKSTWTKGSTIDYTVSPTAIKLTYANSIRNALDDTVRHVQDNTSMLSVHGRAIIDLYVRIKAMGG